MKRREFIAGLGGRAVWPVMAPAEQPAMPVVGVLHQSRFNERTLIEALRKGLAETGIVEGLTVAIEYLWAEDRYDRLPGLAAESVRRQVALIVTLGGHASRGRRRGRIVGIGSVAVSLPG